MDETDSEYPVDHVQIEGSDPTTITAVAGIDTSAGNDGYYQSGTVSGHLYIDTNGDGDQDGGEPDLAAVTVIITDSTGMTQTVSTDASGNYTATVPPGSTTVDVDETDSEYPTGYVQTEGNDPTDVTAVAGTDTSAGNDGYYLGGRIVGHLYIDTNGDGDQDGSEPDLNAVDLIITDSTGVTQTVTTDASGNYTATVPAGSTTVDVDESDGEYPTGYVQTEGNDPTDVTAVAGVDTSAGNDGYYQSGTVSGHLYIDTNGDGDQDSGELDLVGVTLVITDSTGVTQTVSTDASGNYTATVPPGSTTVDVDETDSEYPVNHVQTEGSEPTTITAVAGTDTDAGNDGYYQSGTVSGHLYIDTNGDGDQDGSEPDLAAVIVIITDSNGMTQTVSTDASGNYTATVPPGSTTVDVDETDAEYPVDHVQTEGSEPTTITAVAGIDTSAGNDGYYLAGTVSGHLYIDTNGDGDQDSGELDLDGVDLIVTDSNGVTQTVSTDASGNYTATVPPGSTTVDVDETDTDYPTGYVQTEGNDPTDVTAVAGIDTDAGNDGYYQSGTVSGHLYIDTNGDGDQDSGELDLDGVDIIVTDSNGVTQTVSTDASGNYTATVPPGSTTVDVDETDSDYPTGYVQTEGNDPTDVTAVAGTDTSAGNDGYYLGGRIVGHLYIDTNGDGDQDSGESDLAGVDVVVTDSTGMTQTVATDASGNYTVTVPPGSTTVDVDETDSEYPTGYIQTEGNDPTDVTAVAGTDTSAGNDGYYLGGRIVGHLYIDTNGDGDQDSGESDLAGVDVVVTDSTGVTQTVSTDASGNYTATVPPGSTTVDVDETDSEYPVNHVQTEGSDPTTVTVVAGTDTSVGNDGYTPDSVMIGGAVYEDLNGNGLQELGEPALADVTIQLSNGLTTTTDAQGIYTFTVMPGTYMILERNLGGYTSVNAQPGTVGSLVLDNDQIRVTLVAGESSWQNDFLDLRLASVSGYVFEDLDGDGQSDPGEPGIDGVVVTLSTGITTTTDSLGYYRFTDLLPGTYRVIEIDPAGYNSTGDRDGAANGDNGIDIIVQSGDALTLQNFGDERPGMIVGRVFEDKNQSGVQDIGENAIPSVTVTLSDGRSVLVDANGVYTFTQVWPGNYTVLETDRTGYTSTTSNLVAVYVMSGAVVRNVDFGDRLLLGTIIGHLFVDNNGNGVQDPGEPNLAGVDVIVTDSNGVTQVVTTDADGNYTATVPPGPATLQVDEQTLPPDYILTTGFPLMTINVTDGNSMIGVINGYLPPSMIAGYVYVDSNGNGVHDMAEPALAGVSVLLSNGMTATTTATGAYSFTVASGTYTVTAIDLPTYMSTGAEPGTVGSVVINGNTIVVTVGDGESSQANNFLDRQLAHVWGVIWLDMNRDGLKNDENLGDGQLGGLEVMIYDALTNSLVATITTNLEGGYDFANLMPGEYFLQFTVPNGFQVSPVYQGGDGTMDSDVDPENDLRTPIVLLLSGENNLMLDMGISLAPTDLDVSDEPVMSLPYRSYLPSVAR